MSVDKMNSLIGSHINVYDNTMSLNGILSKTGAMYWVRTSGRDAYCSFFLDDIKNIESKSVELHPSQRRAS
jgi:hypothetical protein